MFGQDLPFVLSDCDGTIANSNSEVSSETRRSILKYQRKSGYHFSFIIGRLGLSSKVLARELKIALPVIICNGAVISDLETGEVFDAQPLAPNLIFPLLDACEKLKVDPFIYTTNQMAGAVGNPRFVLWKQYQQQLKQKDRWPILEYNTILELKQAIKNKFLNPVQLLIYAFTPTKQKQVQALLEQYHSEIEFQKSLPFMFNITAKGVNKFSALKKWATIVGTNYQNIITFGDNYNDLPMIKGVKKGIAVGNAVAELQLVATKVVEPMTENGVGLELERIIAENA